MLKQVSRILFALAVLGMFIVSPGSEAEGKSKQKVKLQSGRAKNVIFFVGDGMGVSTVTASRIFSVGVDGNLVMDQMPFTALSRTFTTDHITPDSAATMTAMISGTNTNNGIIGLDASTERRDFNQDGDGKAPWTVLEEAKKVGKRVGVVSTARATHATPAACYAHINDRNFENDIALQALPTDKTYNKRLKKGLDLLFGGGRRHFVPSTTTDEEGGSGSRSDGRDLRKEFQAAGYSYVWRDVEFKKLKEKDLPVLGLFNRSHMEYEYDRTLDVGGEPSLTEMTKKAIKLLDNDEGYFLMVESGRIDHAHHAGNAFRALHDTEELDEAIAAAVKMVDLKDTLIVVSADHSHVFNIAGYAMRPYTELPYTPTNAPSDYKYATRSGILNLVYDLNPSTGEVVVSKDSDGVPYTVLVYANGPGFRGRTSRVDPSVDTFAGLDGAAPGDSNDPEYIQEAAVPLGSETHAAEDVAIYAIGAGSSELRGTLLNTSIAKLMRKAFGF